tara:strand:+ start:3496 stop:3912 length:417 start_codon:yes stop_codon:yes gene_type:complete
MLNKKAKNRLTLFIVVLLLISSLTLFIFKNLEKNVLFFYSPSEVRAESKIIFGSNIRVGGMVKNGSVEIIKNEIKFIITDYKNEIIVTYSGTVPALFAEGKGVVAEGKLKDKKYFLADRILAKHDENYMPPEIKESLK